MIISHVSLGVIAKIHEIVGTVQWIKFGNDVALYIKSLLGMALAYIQLGH